MQHQPTRDRGDLPDPDVLAGAVLGLLIHDRSGLQSRDELARKLAGLSGDVGRARVQVDDALADLAAHGLIHQLDGFVFASQSGLRGYALTG